MSVEAQTNGGATLRRPRHLDESVGWAWRLSRGWAVVVLAFSAVIALDMLLLPIDPMDATIIRRDVPVLPLMIAGLALVFAASYSSRVMALGSWVSERDHKRWVVGLSGAAAAGLYAATFQYTPMSMDEVMAQFDAVIFSQGRTVAEVAAEWRAYVPALQWQFRVETPGHAYWASMYLPGNAAVRAVFERLGDGDMAGPFWSALSLFALYGVARRMWPARPDAAVLAVLLMATSSQFLINGLTAYAMPAHLALNLLWLWLFLTPGRGSQAGAAAVAFVATGLHQLIFHPLFAAPFLVLLLLQRRWRLAGFHAAAYAVIGLFWMSYWGFALPGEPTGEMGRELGLHRWIGMAVQLLAEFDIRGTPWMVENLFRFLLWQSLLVAPLAVIGLKSGRRDPILLALAGGAVLTTLAMWLLLPNQGFGWGYRYLHGFIGSLCLLGAAGWVAASDGMTPDRTRRAGGVVMVSILVSALVVAPFRFHQSWGITRPYADALEAVQASPAEVVLIDDTGVFEARILPRNDPFLRETPKVMMLDRIEPSDLEHLCMTRRIELFDHRTAEPLGLPIYSVRPEPRMVTNRAVLERLGCAQTPVAPRGRP